MIAAYLIRKCNPMVAPGKGLHEMEGVRKDEENYNSDSIKQSGVLNRITGLFMTRRHFNIESISVGHTESSDISRMTFVVHVENEQTS